MMERKWRRQLSIPSKKGVGFGIKTTLILAQLCTVTVSELAPGFTLTAPASITVQHGLCVHVPCHFTYSNPQQGSTEELFAYWLKKKKGSKYFISSSRYVSGLLTATNDPRQRIQNRFWLTGDPEQGDCSFGIGDAQLEDSGAYYFRIERGENLRWNFVTNQDPVGASLRLLVTESPEELFTGLFGSLSAASLVLLGVCLFKILLCWLVFHVTFCFLIWRKAPSKGRASWPMMGMMPTESNYSSSPLESDSTQDNSVGSEIKRGGVLEHTYHR